MLRRVSVGPRGWAGSSTGVQAMAACERAVGGWPARRLDVDARLVARRPPGRTTERMVRVSSDRVVVVQARRDCSLEVAVRQAALVAARPNQSAAAVLPSPGRAVQEVLALGTESCGGRRW